MKWIFGLALAALMAVGGFYAGYRWREPQVITKVEVQEVEKIVTQTVRETVTQPGGTVVVRETITANQSTEIKQQIPQSAVEIPRPNWSVGMLWNPSNLPDYKPTAAEIGYRVGGNLWTVGLVNWQDRSLLLGVKYEF